MPAAVPFLTNLGIGLAGTFGVTVGATLGLAIGVTTVIGAAVSFRRFASLKNETGRPTAVSIVVRSTETTRNGVYGESLVGGVLTYANVAGTENRELYYEVVHTAHEIDSFVDWRIEGKTVPLADVDDINTSPPGDGSVTADTGSHGLDPVQGAVVAYFRGHTGTASQAADSMLDSAFTEITSNHRHRGRAKTVARFDLLTGTEPVWDGRPPSAPSAVLRGKKVYDPREDVGLSPPGTHDLSDPATWEWSDNPALCLADYLIDSNLGLGIDSSRIDYASVIVAADACDALVEIPPAASPANTEKRFTCNLTYHSGMEYAEVIQQILDCMSGRLQYFNGQFRIYAGVWESPSFDLDENDLIGPYSWQKEPSSTRGDRYNQVRGSYVDPDRGWKVSQFLTVNDTTLRAARDNDRVLPIDLDLPGVTGEYTAQRLAFRALYQADATGVLEFPIGYQGCNIRVGDTGTVTLADLNFEAKTFRCVGVRYLDMNGVVVVLKEDASDNYEDPDVADYGERSAAGVITFPRYRDNFRVIGGGNLLSDPYFTRSVELWDGTAGQEARYFWGRIDQNDGISTILRTGGVLGGALELAVDAGQSNLAGVKSLPREAALVVTGDWVRVSVRVRKTNSGTLGSAQFIVTAGAGFEDGTQNVSWAPIVDLDHTDINAWTALQWQEYSSERGVVNNIKSTAQAPYVNVDVVLWFCDIAMSLEVDCVVVSRSSAP